MNKKGAIEMSAGIIVAIVLLMAVLVLGLTLTRGIFNKQDFKITEEVCHKEYELKGTFDLNGRQIPYEELCSEIDCSKRPNITLNIKNESKQTCEQKEVDEIIKENKTIWKNSYWCEFKDKSQGYGATGDSEGTREEVEKAQREFEKEYECVGGGSVLSEEVLEEGFNISKKDLTIEWIDLNCEIQKGECLRWGKRNSKGIAICKNEIIKYKCFDYTMEVLR